MILEVFTLLCIFFLILQYLTQRRPKNFPPGPIGIPVLGYLPFIKLPIHIGLGVLAKKYGKICSVFFANHPVVVLTGADLIKEAFKDSRFSGRPPLRPFLERSWGAQRGILIGTGNHWIEQRRFIVKNLKDFGYGQRTMESLIMDEVVETVASLKKEAGHPISIDTRFAPPVLNSLWHITSGERFGHDDPRLLHVINILIDAFNEVKLFGPVFFMGWLTKLLPRISGWNKFMACLPPTYEFLGRQIAAHEQSLDMNNHRDLIDAFLTEIKRTTDEASSFYKEEGKKSLLVVLLDLFAAGAETTSTTLTWAILYLMKNTRVQKNIQQEIDLVVGCERLPSLIDRARMPYMESFIAETLRMSTVTPAGLMHSTTEDVEFHGYNIPKNTMVIGNFWDVHYNEDYWGDPQNCRPERFINPDGSFRKDENVISFSTGKRTCLGESLARDELFLFLTSFCQQLEFSIDASTPEPTYESPFGPISKPKPFKVIMTQRNTNSSHV